MYKFKLTLDKKNFNNSQEDSNQKDNLWYILNIFMKLFQFKFVFNIHQLIYFV